MIETLLLPLNELPGYSVYLWQDSASDLWPLCGGLGVSKGFPSSFVSFVACFGENKNVFNKSVVLTKYEISFIHILLFALFSLTAVKSLYTMLLFLTLQPTCVLSVQLSDRTSAKHIGAGRRGRSIKCQHERSCVCTDRATFSWNTNKVLKHWNKLNHQAGHFSTDSTPIPMLTSILLTFGSICPRLACSLATVVAWSKIQL